MLLRWHNWHNVKVDESQGVSVPWLSPAFHDKCRATTKGRLMNEAIKGAPQIWKATDLTATTQRAPWLAKGWLPRAAVSVLVGDEGIGKSLFWVTLAAAITTGKPVPELGIPARDPAVVVLVITEDDWQNTVLPRLQVAEADVNNIRVLCGDEMGGGAPEFPRDLAIIEAMDEKPALVVVDTWIDTLASGVSVTGSQAARKALLPMKELATHTGASVLLMTHTNRVKTKNARDKYGISAEIRKAVRMALLAQQDDSGMLCVGPEKTNTSELLKAQRFSIQKVQAFDPSDEDDGTVARLLTEGEADYTARELLAVNMESDTVGNDRQDRIEAVTWLRGYLELHGCCLSSEAKKEARIAGLALRTLQRARKDLKVVIGYTGQPPVSTWMLPVSEVVA
jgi:hypothetical protein